MRRYVNEDVEFGGGNLGEWSVSRLGHFGKRKKLEQSFRGSFVCFSVL
jgi:hypothetical protein